MSQQRLIFWGSMMNTGVVAYSSPLVYYAAGAAAVSATVLLWLVATTILGIAYCRGS